MGSRPTPACRLKRYRLRWVCMCVSLSYNHTQTGKQRCGDAQSDCIYRDKGLPCQSWYSTSGEYGAIYARLSRRHAAFPCLDVSRANIYLKQVRSRSDTALFT
ncbi:MAG: hypothetical protein IPJ64_00410 [Saprospiraceae bacterium]|nr:hypothetical protein [Saprospiraceae bacterium]